MMKFVVLALCLAAVSACDYSGYSTAASTYAQCTEKAARDGKLSEACPCAATFLSALSSKFSDCPGVSATEAGIKTFQKEAGCTGASLRATMACDYAAYGAAAQTYAQCVEKNSSGGNLKAACPCAATFMSALTGKFASCPGVSSEETGVKEFQKEAGCSSASVRTIMACDYTGYSGAAQTYAQCVEANTSDEKKACPCAATFMSALKGKYASCPGAAAEETGVETFQKAYGC